MRRSSGFSALELTVAIAIVGVLFAIAIPIFGSLRMSVAFSSGEQAVRSVLTRARWSAINSGRSETRVLIEGNFLRVRAGTAADSPIVTSMDISDYAATISGTNLPLRVGARGERLNGVGSTPTITIENTKISSATTFVYGPLGRIDLS